MSELPNLSEDWFYQTYGKLIGGKRAASIQDKVDCAFFRSLVDFLQTNNEIPFYIASEGDFFGIPLTSVFKEKVQFSESDGHAKLLDFLTHTLSKSDKLILKAECLPFGSGHAASIFCSDNSFRLRDSNDFSFQADTSEAFLKKCFAG